MAWLPNSQEIVVWAQGTFWRVDVANRSAREIPFHVRDTREIRQALRVPTAVAPDRFDVKQLRWVNVSPSGDTVIFSALGYLYARALPNGTPRRLTTQNDHFEFFPSFSSDGKFIVYVAWSDTTQGTVRKLDLKTGNETTITAQSGKYLTPRFSPDGRAVVYVKAKGGYLTPPWNSLDTGIYLAAANGKGTPERVSKDGESPHFGARNDVVYFTRIGVKDEVELFSKLIKIDLADQRRETELAKGEFISSFEVSPDSQWLAFTERFHSYVTPLPQASKPVSVGSTMTSLPVKQLDLNAASYLHWAKDSGRLYYSLGDQLFSTALKDAFAFMPGAPMELPKPAETGLPIGFVQYADKPAGATAITGGRIVTMRGDEVIEDGIILVSGNRITAVGRRDSIQIPAAANVVDATGKVVIPGLIDVHWHGAMGEDEIIPQQSWVNYSSLAFGVTTLHDPSNKTSEIFTQAEMQRAGLVVGPRIFSTGTILYGAKANVSAVVNSEQDALTHLKRLKSAGAISVKSYNQPRREQRQQILSAARQTDMMVVPEGGSLFQSNMNMVVDGHTGVEHAIPIAIAYDDVKQLWSQTQVGYTPTLNVAFGGLDGEHYWYATTEVWKHPILSKYVPRSVLQPRSFRRLQAPEEDFNVIRVAKTATELSRSGVRVNIGAHGQREGLGVHWEMWMFGKGGMTSLEAIRAATLNPAHYLGMDKDIGSLEVGKLADLVIVDGDILGDIRHSDRIHRVMLNGRIYDPLSMNEVGSTKRVRKPFYFEGANGANASLDVLGHARCGCE